MIRAVGILCLGVIVSLMLFWFMQNMVMNDQSGLQETENLQMVEFIRLKKETQIKTKDRKIPEKPLPQHRPPPPQMKTVKTRVEKNIIPNMDVPNLDLPLQTDRFSGITGFGLQVDQGIQLSTNVIPLVRIPPRYPMRAARRRIEGWVKVEFTITKTGMVKDAVVVDAQPPEIFDRAALRAISRWKFKAKIIDGDAYEQRALQVLQFKLSK